MSGVSIGAGIFLCILSLILFVFALPTLENSVDTRPGTALENTSATNKNILSIYSVMFAMMPAFMFGAGILLAWKG